MFGEWKTVQPDCRVWSNGPRGAGRDKLEACVFGAVLSSLNGPRSTVSALWFCLASEENYLFLKHT